VIAGIFVIRSRVDPDRAITPCARLIDRDQFGRGDRRLPRDTIAKIKSFANRWDKRECDKEQRLSNRARLHLLWRTGKTGGWPAWRAFHFNSERAAAQSKFSNARAKSGVFILRVGILNITGRLTPRARRGIRTTQSPAPCARRLAR